MNYKNRVEKMKLRNEIVRLINLFKFKSVNLNNGQKLILLGNIILLTSLFIPWLRSSLEIFSGNINSFSNYVGNIGYIIIILIFIMLFNLFSIQKKEKLRLYSGTHIRHFPVYQLFGGFSLILSLVALRFIGSLNAFSSVIETNNGAIIAIIGSITIIIGGVFEKETSSEHKLTYVNNTENEKADYDENNMKLPF